MQDRKPVFYIIVVLCKSEASLILLNQNYVSMWLKNLILACFMELWEKIKKYESMHIVFWLIKDSCWMLQFKWLGILMVIPTLTIAAYIVYITRNSVDMFINLAVFSWICANSFWMFIEFFTSGQLKLWASIPFGLGFIFVGIYYYKTLFSKTSINK